MTIRLALKTNPPGVNRDIAGRLDEVCFTRKRKSAVANASRQQTRTSPLYQS
jgi:hypothetical protein